MTMTLSDNHLPAYPDEAAPPSMHCIGVPAPAWVNVPQWRLATVGMRLGEMDIVPGDIATYHAPAGWICLATAQDRAFEAFSVDRKRIWRNEQGAVIAWPGPDRLYLDADAPCPVILVEVRIVDLPRDIQDLARAGEPHACQADAVTLSRLVRITENAAAIERVLTRAALPAARQAVQETVIDLATMLLRSGA